MLPDPSWPVVVLALIQIVDGLLCIKPAAFIANCFDDVGFPIRFRWVFPVIKFSAALGLLAGLWIPYIGFAANVGLVLYFVVAIGAHLRAKDLGRNLFINATGMLLLCLAICWFAFL